MRTILIVIEVFHPSAIPVTVKTICNCTSKFNYYLIIFIFNEDYKCAFIRHVFNVFYQDFTAVETAERAFTPIYTFLRAIHNFRNAVLSYGQSIRNFRTNREFTSLKQHVPATTLKQFPGLITISPVGYTFALTHEFTKAIATAEKAAADRT